MPTLYTDILSHKAEEKQRMGVYSAPSKRMWIYDELICETTLTPRRASRLPSRRRPGGQPTRDVVI